MERVYTQHFQQLLGLAMQILYSLQDAEDCVQEVIAEIMENLPRYRCYDREHMVSLLTVSVRNRAINLFKKRKRHHRRTDYRETAFLVDASVDIAQTVEDGERADRLRGLISQLKKKPQDAIVMYYYLDMSYEEISQIMGITKSHVGMLLTRAKRKLFEIGGEEFRAYKEN